MKKSCIIVVFLLSITVLGKVASHAFRATAQQSQSLYELMLIADGMDFVTAGGGSYGYDNYFKWNYATWRKSPERTFLQKAFFWDRGILNDASEPPKEYGYPARFQQPSQP